ncbi:hypothetical protein ABLV98_15510 [Staphylococcus sp. 50Mo3-1]|uniref:hypothetical protein n=1 Tax=Staphylococcus sp. 50Mo3-2 TaxID=3135642 RepID=UPI0033EE9A8D
MKDREYKDAWQELKEILMEKYKKFSQKEEKYIGIWEQAELFSVVKVLYKMDKLDDSDEFNSLLDDLEDE